MIHFVSKGAMDIEGLGKDIVKRFMTEGIVSKIEDIYRLDYEAILSLEGWKDKSVENLRSGVEKSKSQPLWRLLPSEFDMWAVLQLKCWKSKFNVSMIW